MADLTIRNLAKHFGSVTAVVGLDLEVADGEFLFLLGPSGCGKTTTLRMVAGLEMPTAGEIRIGGRDVTFLRARHRNVGMVFQDYGLYPHMTVFANIAYPLRVRGLGRAEIARRVGEVAERMRIGDVLERMPDALSAGQLQRVAIARMLVRQADIFLMDEPMSHLDAQLRGQMRAELRHLQKEIGTTTIFVTHDQIEAMTMGDRIVVMDRGRMLQAGTPLEVFERPASEFVATFVGEPHMNVIDVTLTREDGRPVADAGAFAVPLDPAWVERHGLGRHEGRRLRLGIRPEHVGIGPAAAAGGRTVAGTVMSFEPTGTENIFVVEAGALLITARAPTEATQHLAHDGAARLSLGFSPDWLYLFDPEDGRTLAQAAAALAEDRRVPA